MTNPPTQQELFKREETQKDHIKDFLKGLFTVCEQVYGSKIILEVYAEWSIGKEIELEMEKEAGEEVQREMEEQVRGIDDF